MILHSNIASWAGVIRTKTALIDCGDINLQNDVEYIPHGGGCSMGDASFLTAGYTVASNSLKNITIDKDNGLCRLGAGVTVGELHRFLLAQNVHFPIYGGTQWATIGGAIASDIHGKNQHKEGTFGNHLASVYLDTPSAGRITCSPTENSDLFAATIGGMGLTGMIYGAELKIRNGSARAVRQMASSFSNFDKMFELFEAEHDGQFASILILEPHIHGFFISANEVDDPVYLPSKSLDFSCMPHIPIVSDKILALPDFVG